jgi:hypothetical protein
MTVAFTAYVSAVPTAGLTPTWSTAYDAVTGVEQTVGLPSFDDLGSGLYSFEPPTGYDFTGIIDLGVTADPRYLVYRADTIETFGAFDPDPLAGLAPGFLVYKNLDTGANVLAPTITELGNGLYKFDKPAIGDPLGGIIELGPSASPEYLKYDAQNVTTPGGGDGNPPVLTIVSPAAGGTLLPGGAVTIEVTDVDGTVFVELAVTYPGGATEVVFRDDDYRRPFSGTRVAIANGFRYVVNRDGGWPTGNPRFEVAAVDAGGARL